MITWIEHKRKTSASHEKAIDERLKPFQLPIPNSKSLTKSFFYVVFLFFSIL